jgi:purine nucleosidase
MRVVLDTDPGIDDALAILLALRSPEIELRGITTVYGNVLVDQGTRNALAVLAAVGAEAVEVHRGAERPLLRRATTASFFHGADGLGNIRLPDSPVPPSTQRAAEFLVEAAGDDSDPLTVVAMAPLTNVATACRLDPTWPRRLERLIIMGGAVAVPGNVTPVAEANVYADPEAAAIVLSSGAPITLVGLDVTMRAALSEGRFRALRGPAIDRVDPFARLAVSLLDYYVAMSVSIGHPDAALHDPLAVAVAFCPELITTRRLRVEVECQGTLTRGETVAWLSGTRERIEDRGTYDDAVGVEPVEGAIDVASDVDAERFLELFVERVLGVDAGTR